MPAAGAAGRIRLTLEGGYNLYSSSARSASSSMSAMFSTAKSVAMVLCRPSSNILLSRGRRSGVFSE